MRKLWLAGLLGCVAFVGAVRGESFSVAVAEADFDRWMYSFNSAPGARSTAPTFGAVGEGVFDDRDGQFHIGFNTALAGIPTALPAGKRWRIDSVTVTATHSAGAVVYDPTFDDYRSYLDPSDSEYIPDADAGRPVELLGVGLRGGYTQLGFGATEPGPITFEEGDIFAFGDPTAVGIRNAFAADALGNDVSNVIKNRQWSTSPWATGATNVAPGSNLLQGVAGVSPGSTLEFGLNLSLPDVEDYIISGLEHGGLFFSLTSLHSTSQSGGSNPNFYTRDNFDPAALAPSLLIRYSIVPEPSSWALAVWAAGLACVAALRRSRLRRIG